MGSACIEMRFAHLKRMLPLGRLRLRGPCGAQDEFTLAAIAEPPTLGEVDRTPAAILHGSRRASLV